MDDALELDRLSPVSHEPMLTVHEAAVTLRVSEATVWRRIKDGSLDAYRIGAPGTAVRIPCRAVRELMRDYREAAG